MMEKRAYKHPVMNVITVSQNTPLLSGSAAGTEANFGVNENLQGVGNNSDNVVSHAW